MTLAEKTNPWQENIVNQWETSVLAAWREKQPWQKNKPYGFRKPLETHWKSMISTIRCLLAHVIRGRAPCTMSLVHGAQLVKLLENQRFWEAAAASRSPVKSLPGS